MSALCILPTEFSASATSREGLTSRAEAKRKTVRSVGDLSVMISKTSWSVLGIRSRPRAMLEPVAGHHDRRRRQALATCSTRLLSSRAPRGTMPAV